MCIVDRIECPESFFENELLNIKFIGSTECVSSIIYENMCVYSGRIWPDVDSSVCWGWPNRRPRFLHEISSNFQNAGAHEKYEQNELFDRAMSIYGKIDIFARVGLLRLALATVLGQL